MDYSIYKTNMKIYSGAEKKIGVTIQGEDYILKFPKNTRFGRRNNHISEYIGCRIFASFNIEVQETYLGTYKEEIIVAIKDFVGANQNFVAFNDVGESSIEEDKDRYTYSYTGITEILLSNNKLENPKETVKMFWLLYVIDALLGNFDRHGGNWGFIKENNIYRLAPVFDNGSCLFPNLTDEDEMQSIINSEEETNKRIYTFPTSQILLNNRKSSYYEVINSLKYEECNEALETVFKNYNQNLINKIIDKTKYISDIQKAFYKHIIKARYTKIIKNSYERWCNK
ncbi:MAG: HipA domain-containing protein [Tenericutes bacterium]|nr:HipA domain-containing protein [Mycoplasmatota bacterium]